MTSHCLLQAEVNRGKERGMASENLYPNPYFAMYLNKTIYQPKVNNLNESLL
jgi:hypothetical protein